jgi:hypothetical protein
MAEIRGGNFLEGAILGAVTAGISSGLSATGLNNLVKTTLVELELGIPEAVATAAGKAVSNTIAAATVAGAQGKDVGAVLIRGLVNAGADVGGAVLARSIAGLGGDSGPMADAAKFFKDNPAIANATASGLGSAIIATAQGGDVGEAITYGVTSSLVTSGIKGTLGNNANTRLQQDLVKYLTPVVQAAVTGGDVERALQTSIVSGAVDYLAKGLTQGQTTSLQSANKEAEKPALDWKQSTVADSYWRMTASANTGPVTDAGPTRGAGTTTYRYSGSWE